MNDWFLFSTYLLNTLAAGVQYYLYFEISLQPAFSVALTTA